ncbi:GHKL domain-containing protein [Aquimarina sp. BL5]|uniref:sensor histidine kinase n=1 Tax=Aquimarina sp. BL5 TaxID=1714860 RepID=UPI000E554EAC|nr:ATP-binding protein [Aquimarina sp. BL5]AXT52599.1 GHKL domain-containing protein [Aquimarina sp. BL5]RKN11663.1 GHKL domain-containing protein [Aquimarina sp. BL5]
MNSLLKRQIRKKLSDDLKNHPEIQELLAAIDSSYNTYEEQFSMLQRAMSISSQELFDANIQLTEEAKQQRLVIERLNDAIKTLRSIDNKKDTEVATNIEDLTGIELATLIEEQAAKISDFEKQRAKMLKDLEKSNEELTSYAQVVSHDLKSPLRNVSALITWIKEDADELSGTVLSHFGHIEQNIEKMDSMIGGILEYSLIDKKDKIVNEVNLNVLIYQTIESLHAPDFIEFSIDNKLPTIRKDPHRIKQLFQNLISNAVKGMDKEEGYIYIGSKEEEEYWEFYIKDNGKGIPEKYHEKIFKIFQSIDSTKESTGIGLSIVKKIIDYYEGKIWLESVVGKGTTFFFTIKK